MVNIQSGGPLKRFEQLANFVKCLFILFLVQVWHRKKYTPSWTQPGVWTHDFQIMDSTFHGPEMLVLTTGTSLIPFLVSEDVEFFTCSWFEYQDVSIYVKFHTVLCLAMVFITWFCQTAFVNFSSRTSRCCHFAAFTFFLYHISEIQCWTKVFFVVLQLIWLSLVCVQWYSFMI